MENHNLELLRCKARGAALALTDLSITAAMSLAPLAEELEAAEAESRVILSQINAQRSQIGAAYDQEKAEAEVASSVRLHDRVKTGAGTLRKVYERDLTKWGRVIEKAWDEYLSRANLYYAQHPEGMNAKI